MWLRNYYNALTATLLSATTASDTSTPTNYNPPIRIRNVSGVYSNMPSREPETWTGSMNKYNTVEKAGANVLRLGKDTMVYSASPSSSDISSICFGTGTTPVTYEDYKLETPITSGLTVVSSSGNLTQTTFDNVTHHYKFSKSFTVNNTSASPITLNEFGIFVYNYSTAFMVYHEVFATPITLNPAESAVVEFIHDAEVYNYTPY